MVGLRRREQVVRSFHLFDHRSPQWPVSTVILYVLLGSLAAWFVYVVLEDW